MEYIPHLATPEDAPDILRTRRDVEEWLRSQGVRQWDCVVLQLPDVQEQIQDNQWYILRQGIEVIGGLRVLIKDDLVWGWRAQQALYIHSLMVAPRYRGMGIGQELLLWAEREALQKDIHILRLDCVESNSRLRSWYAEMGFVCVGRKSFDGPWYSVALFEKRIQV